MRLVHVVVVILLRITIKGIAQNKKTVNKCRGVIHVF